MSKNLKILKIEFIHFFKPKFDGESDANLKKMIGAREKGVSSTFWQLLTAFWPPKHVFWRIFDVFAILRSSRSEFGGGGPHELKKIEIARNGRKHT